MNPPQSTSDPSRRPPSTRPNQSPGPSPLTTTRSQLPPPQQSQLHHGGGGPLPLPLHTSSTSPHGQDNLPPSRQPQIHSTYSPPGLQPGPQPPPQPPPTGPITRSSILNPIPPMASMSSMPSMPLRPPPISTAGGPLSGSVITTSPTSPDQKEDPLLSSAAAVARARSTSSRLSPEPALTLLPEDQRAIGHGARRPFQRRRRSRACDACRMRKTKCDTPDAGPCASCVAASLVCKFSEGGDERRRVGPARKLRALESEVQVLKSELERERQSKQLLRSGAAGAVDPMRPPLGPMPMWPQPGSRDQFAGFAPPPGAPMRPELQGYPPQPQGEGMMTFPPLGSMLPMPPQGGAFDPMGVPEEKLGMRNKRYSTDSEAEGGQGGKRIRSEESQWGGQYYGSTSAPSFATNYRDFVEQLGFAPPAFNPNLPNLYSTPLGRLQTDQFPLLSDNLESGGDLRRFFPPREVGERLKEAFRTVVQRYTPMFWWPGLEREWRLCWDEPLWEAERERVRDGFCVVCMVMAVGAQVGDEEVGAGGAPGGGGGGNGGGGAGPNGPGGCLSGWRFFELARKFHNLNNPVYTLADCTIFILMSLYLDGASLPSPTWMLTGATCRVAQDLGLHRPLPPSANTSRTDLEARNRLLWTAFILDQKLSLSLGRPAIFNPNTIEVPLPGLLDNEGTGCEDDEGENGWGGAERALACFRANVGVCRWVGEVTELRLTEGGGSADVERLLRIDDRLRSAWAEFPPEFTDPRSREGLEIPALRPLCNSQHARLSLFRSFSDFSTPLSPTFRTFCLSNSIIISKFTAHLLTRSSYHPNFDADFAAKTNDLVHIHVFRAATILLLAYNLKTDSSGAAPQFQNVDFAELDICIRALKSAAARHPAAGRYFGVFREFCRLFNFELRGSERSSPTPQGEGLAFSAGSGEGSPGDYGVFSAPGGGSYSEDQGGPSGGGGSGGPGGGGIDMSQVMNVQGDGLDWDAMRDMMENDAGFGNLMSGNVAAASQQQGYTPTGGAGGTPTGMQGTPTMMGGMSGPPSGSLGPGPVMGQMGGMGQGMGPGMGGGAQMGGMGPGMGGNMGGGGMMMGGGTPGLSVMTEVPEHGRQMGQGGGMGGSQMHMGQTGWEGM